MKSHLPQELLAAFDRGGDPLDDPGLRAWLLEHPEQLAAFAMLRAQLRTLSSMPADLAWPVPRSKRPWWLLASGAGLSAAVLTLWFVGSTPAPSSQGSAVPSPGFAPPSAVRSVVVSTQTVGRDGVHEAILWRSSLVQQAIDRHTVASPPQANVTSHSTRSVARLLAP